MPSVRNLTTDTPWQEIRTMKADWHKADAKMLGHMLHQLHLVRAFEETVLELVGENLVHGPAHSSIGQEGSAVGCLSALRSSDQINGTHRAHHHFLAKALPHVLPDGFDPLRDNMPTPMQDVIQRTLAEIMGLEQGYCHGRGGSMHLRWKEAGVVGTNAIVGGGVPIATGVAYSRKMAGEGDVVVTFFGDGALHQGAVAESFNLAALWDLPILFFIDNNQIAVSTSPEQATRETRLSSRGLAYGIPSYTCDGMNPLAVRLATDKALKELRAGRGPIILEAHSYRYFHQNGPLPGSAFGYRSKEDEAAWRARDPLDRMAKEMIALGHLDKKQVAAVRAKAQESMERAAAALTEPDGNQRSIRPALWPDPKFVDHGVRGNLSELDGKRYEELETFAGELEERKFVDLVAGVMGRRMEEDERIFVLGEDVSRLRGGTNGATRGLPERFPDRVVSTPITENGFCGVAGGVAADGKFRPVIELMYADFCYVAADQLFNQIGKMRHMFGGDLPVPVVARGKVAAKSGYGSQHSMDPAGLYAQFPGWRIVAPSTPFDYVGLMNSALACEDPVLVIEHLDLYTAKGLAPKDDLDYYIPLGKAKVMRDGNDFTVLAALAMVQPCINIAVEMGISAEVIDLRSLDRAGIDWETIGASLAKTGAVIIVEQGAQGTSYGGGIADELQRRFFDLLDQPVKRVTGGEAAPTISKVLDLAANASDDDVRRGYADVMRDAGLGQVAE
ncbi:MAG TPA: thiamine pyrophosphate-dependent enzyme [Alphaproteobacteria bacterium]|nr:thiamine pyrophosphate-dependent enzyme [Alphaproteobacteria bacterium]